MHTQLNVSSMASFDDTTVKPYGVHDKCSVILLVPIHFPTPLTTFGLPPTLLLSTLPWLCLLAYVKHKLHVSPIGMLMQLLQATSFFQH